MSELIGSKNIKRVGVVGLGPGGLAAAKELRAVGMDVIAFDSRNDIGGIWSRSSSSATTGVYDELVMNTARQFAEFSDFPWSAEDFKYLNQGDYPGEEGVYPHNVEANAYLNAYAKHFNLESSFRLNTWVKSILHNRDTNRFTIHTVVGGQDTKDGNVKEDTHEFDAVVIASGIYRIPNHPLKNTVLKSFQGSVLHSQDVRSIRHDFQGKRVLVVGGAVSGSDLCHYLSREGNCALVVNSIRRPHFFASKFLQSNGLGLETALTRASSWISSALPDGLKFAAIKASLQKHFPDQLTVDEVGEDNTELLPPDDFRDAVLSLSTGFVDNVKEGILSVKPEVVSCNEGNTITFRDGTQQDFDVVICATGFQGWDLSILDPDIVQEISYKNPGGKTEVALYKQTIVPDFPNLAFSQSSATGAVFPFSEMQARYFAALWSGTIPQPSNAALHHSANDIKDHRMRGKFNSKDPNGKFTEALGEELGVVPNLFEAMMNPGDLLFCPMYPSFYRTNPQVDGSEVAAKAKERFEWCKNNPPRSTTFDLKKVKQELSNRTTVRSTSDDSTLGTADNKLDKIKEEELDRKSLEENNQAISQ